ncbi:MAG: thymidylate synthase [Methanocellales archaeon]
MAKLIFAHSIEDGVSLLNHELLKNGVERASPRGKVIFLPDVLLIVEKPELAIPEKYSNPLLAEDPHEKWLIENEDGTFETYNQRITKPIDQLKAGIELIKQVPYSRRFSIAIARPWDVIARTPPSLLEIYVQVTPSNMEKQVHLTGVFRSLDTYNFLDLNMLGLTEILNLISKQTGYAKGTLGLFIVNAHYYKRDETRVKQLKPAIPAVPNKHAFLIESENIPFGWRQTLEYVFHEGFEDQTQWGEVFEKQARARFGHRVLIDISNPLENMLDDKAPFTARYGEEYAMRYILGVPDVDKEAKENDIILEQGEVYSYASRARYDRNDLINFKRPPIDQLFHSIQKLKQNKYTRQAFVTISRPWDVFLKDPACLRCYCFYAYDEETLGLSLFMRSNDAFGATHANQYGFARLAEFAAMNSGFKKVRLTLLSANMHIYGDSWRAVKELLRPPMPTAAEMLGLTRKDKDNKMKECK